MKTALISPDDWAILAALYPSKVHLFQSSFDAWVNYIMATVNPEHLEGDTLPPLLYSAAILATRARVEPNRDKGTALLTAMFRLIEIYE